MKKNLTRILSLLLVLVLMVGVLPVSALADGWDLTGELDTEQLLERAEPVEMQASASDFSKILHLDCGRKYFSKNWIVALLYEMQAAGYNQLQLAFGNDGLRFLLNDMSFTANGTTYSHETVVSKVKAGNKAQNSSGDESYLTETEMTEIITKANSLGIEIVPLLNLPGHANAILDIAGDAYNASGSDNTLDVASNANAREFGLAIFKKYVDYFAGKGCKFFSFGADEYANDASGSFSFSRLNATQYSSFIDFINELASYIITKKMTPRAFNDGLYYKDFNRYTDISTPNTEIQCCYWSSGWNGYNVAAASTISANGHSMINTHGDFYYVLKDDPDKFREYDYTYAANFSNTVFQGSNISKPVGSMFCIWCDKPNKETETEIAANVRYILRAMAARMDNKSIDTINTAVVENGFNEDGTLNNAGTEFEIVDCDGGTTPTLEVGKTLTLCIANGASAEWTASPEGIVQIEVSDSANANRSVSGNSVKVTALQAGNVTITATNPENESQKATFALTVQPRKATDITVYVGQDHTITVNRSVQIEAHPNANIATVTTAAGTSSVPVLEQITSTADLESGKSYLIESNRAKDNHVGALLTNVIDGNKLKLSGEPSTTLSDSAKWTITKIGSKYYIQSSKQYLTIGNGTAGLNTSKVELALSTMQNGGSTYWDISRTPVWTTYHLNQYGGVDATVAGGYTADASNDAGSCWNIYKITEGTTPSTTITFHGVALGNTTATIGGVDYNIHVVSESLANVDPLSVEYWITNQLLKDDQGSHTMSIQAADANVNSEDGVAIDGRTPNLAYNDDNKEHHYWMTVRLDSNHKQTASDGVDQTAAGTTLTHVRYFNSAWQYKTLAGEWKSFQTGDQVVAYYLQKTDVTKDVETYVKDWGYGTSSDTQVNNPDGQVALTIAVVYPDGTVQPTEDNMYSQATTIFNYWDSRNIGIVSPKVNENYSISKMTITDGVRTKNSSYNYWTPSDTITWNKVELESGAEWYDETVVWQKSDGTTPMVNASDEKIKAKCTWSEKNTAKLVLIYLEPIQKKTNLNLVYFDRTDNVEIQRMQVAMKYNQGDATPSYFTHLYNNGVQIAYPDKTNWPGLKASDADYLPDSAYVVNAGGVDQTFSKDITTNVGIADKYKSGLYSYDGAEISTDGKTLTLYFALDNSKLDNWYVLDFGLPIEISVSDLVTNFQDVTAVSVKGTQLSDNPVTTDHGELTYDANLKVITYTPTTTWAGSSAASVSFNLQYANGQKVRSDIGVIPASNILYEENFLTQAEDTNANRLPWALDTAGSLGSTKQATHKNDVEAIFGYDDAYKNSTGSNGAWKVSNLSKESSVSKPLTAEFYGNALDVIGTCDANTAMLMMIISNVDNPSAAKKPVLVDTRYNGGTLNQVPFAHVELESDAHYSVNIRAYYAPAIAASNTNTATTFGAVSAISDFAASASYADQAVWNQMARDLAEDGLSLDDVEFVRFDDTASAAQTDSLAVYADLYSVQQPARPEGTELAIDAFRVYRSSDSNDAIGEKYIASEQNIVYNNIIDVVQGKIVAFTEGTPATEIEIKDYEAAGGPQNEIYLPGGHSVAFTVANAVDTIQVSLRAVQGVTSWADATTGGNLTAISSNTEMYYTVHADTNGIFTITNRGNALLAIGNVKLLSGARTMSASEIDEDVLRASLCAALGLSTEQPQDFQPKTFTARATTLPMLRNKRVSVLITISNDVSYVTVNGVKYTPSRYYASWQKTRLIQFGETLGKYESKTYTIIAYDANGVASAPITVNG